MCQKAAYSKAQNFALLVVLAAKLTHKYFKPALGSNVEMKKCWASIWSLFGRLWTSNQI
jgi:hypothetical protein